MKKNQENSQENSQENNQENGQGDLEENQEAIGGAEEDKTQGTGETVNVEQKENNENQENGQLPQGEQDIQDIKKTTSFIKPVEGVVSSKYGQRNTATGSVPKNHTGVDIAANMGTKIKSATDGEVVLESDQGDYRKTPKNSNRKSKCYLCSL